jgi:beta-galactosidase/beta-glucuronidase
MPRFRELFERYPQCIGGFIWDFADKSLGRTRADGSAAWTLGGDWGDRPHHFYLWNNGLFSPDRDPRPAAFEVLNGPADPLQKSGNILYRAWGTALISLIRIVVR